MKTLPVKSCRTCPMFKPHPMSQGLLGTLVPMKSGFCGYDKELGTFDGVLELGLPPGPARDEFLRKAKRANERWVHDIDKIPDTCPLLAGPITITVSS